MLVASKDLKDIEFEVSQDVGLSRGGRILDPEMIVGFDNVMDPIENGVAISEAKTTLK